MKQFKSIDEILDFAINEEQKAVDFYTALAERMEQQEMKDTFEQYALEEIGHKAKLEAIKNGKKFVPDEKKIQNLKIVDYLNDVDLNKKNITFQDALTIAMKREKAAFRLYSDLAKAAGDAKSRNLFRALAQEEAKHKLRFELEYDDHVLSEN